MHSPQITRETLVHYIIQAWTDPGIKLPECDIKCQKSHRNEHKSDCSSTEETINELAQKMFGVFVIRRAHNFNNPKKLYYWGNYPAYDGLNLLENEGVDYSSDLKVLYLGVGDFRNVAITCASLPDTYERVVTFALNDIETCTLSRLVLFVFMLTKGKFGDHFTMYQNYQIIYLRESMGTPSLLRRL